MMRTPPITLLLLLVVTLSAVAQINPYEQRRSETSGVEFFMTNYGSFGMDVASGGPGFFYPRGSKLGYIFGSGLWFGARKTVADTLAYFSFISYNPNSGSGWANPGAWSTNEPATNSWLDHVSISTQYDRRSGIWIGAAPRRPAWPLWGDRSATPSLFDPGSHVADSADRDASVSGAPAFVPGVTEQFVSRFHDGDTSRYEGEAVPGYPIGLEIEQNIYGFTQPDLENVVIVHYRIINVSGDTFYNCYTGQMIDPDLGQASNDHASYYARRPGLGTAYVFSDGTLNDGTKYGTLVQTVLESPAIDEDQLSDRYRFIRHDKRRYDSVEQMGVATFQNWSLDVDDPKTSLERYLFMSSQDVDYDEGSRDVRTLMSTGPFNMMPGDTARFVFALSILPDLHVPAGGEEPAIEAAARKVIALYRSEPVSGIRETDGNTGALSIGAIHPNPASEATTLELNLPHRSAPRIQLVDALGRVVLVREPGMLEAGGHALALDLDTVAAGMYLVVVESPGMRCARRLVVSGR